MNQLKERTAKANARKLILKKNILLNNSKQQITKVFPNFISINDKNPRKMDDKITFNLDSLIQNLQSFEAKKDQDIDYFLEQFQQLVDATKIPENIQLVLLRSKLGGNARQILINSPELRNEENYEEFKKKLQKNFRIDKSFAEAQDKFITIKQTPNQKVEDFVREFNLVAQKYLAISGHSSKADAQALLQTIKLTRFIESLRPDISYELQKDGPENFEEAVKKAKKIEIAINNSKIELNTLQPQNNSPFYEELLKFSKNQSEEIKDLKEQINSLKIQENKNLNLEKKDPIFCHICKKSNHSIENCFYNKKNDKANKNFASHNIHGNQQNQFFPRSSNFMPRPNRGNFKRNYYGDNQFNSAQNFRHQGFYAQPNSFNPHSFNSSYNTHNVNPQNMPSQSNFNSPNLQMPPPFYLPSQAPSLFNSLPYNQVQTPQISYNTNTSQSSQNNPQNLN